MRTTSWKAAVLVMAITGAASAQRQVESYLVRPNPPIDVDARGRIELEIDSSGSEQKIDVRIERIDTVAHTYRLWMENPRASGTLVDVGIFEPEGNRDDRAGYERRSNRGAGLPLGAVDLTDLEDRHLEVRDDLDRAVLLGVVPSISSSGSGGGSSSRSRSRTPLLRPPGQPIPGAEGEIQVERSGSESELEIETEHFNVVATPYGVWLEDGGGAFRMSGNLEPDRGRSDHGRIAWGSGHARLLPLGATSIVDLEGRRVEIRDSGGVVILLGRIPAAASSSRAARKRAVLSASAAGQQVRARGRLKLTFVPARGRFALDIQARARTASAQIELWLENPGTGALELVETRSWSGGGQRRVRFRWRTRHSQPLPFGLGDPQLLVGRAVELRDPAGQVLLGGSL